MQNKTTFRKNNSGRHTFRYAFIGTLCLVLVLLGFCLMVFSVNPRCGSMDLSATCTSSLPPTAVVTSTATAVPNRSTPTLTATAQPTRAVPPSSGAGNASPTLAMPTDEGQVRKDVEHYEALVAVERALRKAYNLLDVSVRDKEPYGDFIYNTDYTLNSGCWKAGQVVVSQNDSQTWDASIPMQQVSCGNRSVWVTYSWHFTVRMIEGLPEIIKIGLYPTGTGN